MLFRFFLIYIFFFLTSFFFLETKSQILLKGGVQTFLEKGKQIEINLITPLNFYFNNVGDEIQGILEEDIKVGGNVILSRGSKILGVVSKINEPGRFGADGSIEVELNEIIISENERIPIQARISTDTKTVLEKSANILTYDSALISYGAFNGALAGIQYGGIPLAVTSHGASVLAGAGVGAGAGLIGSIKRKGNIPTNSIGKATPFILKSNLYILGDLKQVASASPFEEDSSKEYKGFRFNPLPNKEDIEIVLKEVKKFHDKNYGNAVKVQFELKNKSSKSISVSDLRLLTVKKKSILNPDVILSGSEVFKSIKPGTSFNSSLVFLINSKKEDYYLVLVDPFDMQEVLRVELK